MKPRLLFLLVALLLLGPAPPVRMSAQGADPTYLDLLNRYAAGDVSQPVATLASWPDSRARLAIETLESQAAIDRARAGAMLHSEAALAILFSNPAISESGRARVRAQVDLARWFISHLQDPKPRTFETRWHGLIALLFTMSGERYRAEQEANLGLALDSKNADAGMAVGVFFERFPGMGDWRGFTSAYGIYRWILGAHPDFLEAHLRLGLLETLASGLVTRDARQHLTTVATKAARPDLQALAHLFLGRLDEREKRLDDAAREFELAHAIRPSQSSFVALIRASSVEGRADRVLQLAADYAGRQASADQDDPWLLFRVGVTSGELIEWLRDKARTQ